MKKNQTIGIMLGLFFIATAACAQEGGAVTARVDRAGSGRGEIGSMDVREELRREEEARERRKVELKDIIWREGIKLEGFKAAHKQDKLQIPLLKKKLQKAEDKEVEAKQELNRVESRYNSREAIERDDFLSKTMADFQATYDEEYSTQKEAYEKDEAFVAEHRWKNEDFNRIVLPMAGEDEVRYLTFDGKRAKVRGSFFTVDYETGGKIWHRVPRRAKFSYTHMLGNPFVADVKINPGLRPVDRVSTNTAEREIHVFITKHYDARRREKNRYELLAVAWFVDLNMKRCAMVNEAPVFEPTPMPQQRIVGPDTPEIKEKIEKWTWEGNTAERMKLDETIGAFKQAMQLVKVLNRRIEKVAPAVKDRLAANERNQQDVSKKIRGAEEELAALEEPEEDEEEPTLDDIDLGEAGG